ncbi:MAG: ROK family protein, partial [Chloroflexi bacterium]|nr:ROK family protein [Chloroflexota bacterium]
MAAREVTIGMDVGGTKWETALVDGQGRILASVRTASRYGMRVEELVEGARASVAKLKAQVEGIELVGVGVGFAGQIDPETGTVIGSPNVGWQNVPLKEALEFAFNLPVVVVNDVQAATWVEWKLGSGRGATHLACIFVGTGIGGGLILDGKLYRGSAGSAGEIGHTILNAQGTLCRCGAQGCLEAYAGGWAIALRAQEAVQRDTEGGRLMLALAGGDLRQVTAATVSQAAHTGDPLAARLVQEVGADLG